MLVLLASALLIADQPSPAASPPIVVVGQRIRDAQSRLRDCLARNCKPNEDIDASLALAETQLLAGEYKDAEAALAASLRRNKRHQGSFPIPVSDLYRAHGKVSAHLGEDKQYAYSTWEMYRVLKNAFSDDDEKVFSARMEVAEMVATRRGHERARRHYADIAKDARAAGRPDIAALAELRSYIRHFPPWREKEAMIRRISDSRDPRGQAAALEAKLALAKVAFEKDDVAEAEAIVADMSRFNLRRPILIYAPAYQMVERGAGDDEFGIDPPSAPCSGGFSCGGGGSPTSGAGSGAPTTLTLNLGQFSSPMNRVSANFDDMWIDVEFSITPEGKVSDLKVARSRGDLFWAKPLLASIGGRRYTPARAGSPGSQRLERYTYTSGFEGMTDTRMKDRSPQPRIEYFDLSPTGLTAPS